jgi:hypothetical protein
MHAAPVHLAPQRRTAVLPVIIIGALAGMLAIAILGGLTFVSFAPRTTVAPSMIVNSTNTSFPNSTYQYHYNPPAPVVIQPAIPAIPAMPAPPSIQAPPNVQPYMPRENTVYRINPVQAGQDGRMPEHR